MGSGMGVGLKNMSRSGFCAKGSSNGSVYCCLFGKYEEGDGGERHAVGMVERVRLEKYAGLRKAVGDTRAAAGLEGRCSNCSELLREWVICGSSKKASARAEVTEEGVDGTDARGEAECGMAGEEGRDCAGECAGFFAVENHRRMGRVGFAGRVRCWAAA